jgi:hypothetical protein
MRTVFFVAAVGLVASLFGMPAASQDPAGGTDLFERNLKDWSRTGTGTNPWRLTTGDTLIVDGRVSEQLIPERVFASGTLTFDYRFRVTRDTTNYRGALFVRRSQEGKGVRLDLGDDCGALTASYTGSSDREKTIEDRPSKKVAKPIGDWNTVEVICEGRSITVKVNGKAASALTQVELETGLIALAAEGSEMEFRRMYWKEGK